MSNVLQINRINELIKKSGKTIKEISEATGIRYNILTSYYGGDTSPRNIEVWETLAEYFDVDVYYLMGGSEVKSAKKTNITQIVEEIDKIIEEYLEEEDEVISGYTLNISNLGGISTYDFKISGVVLGGLE